MRRIVFIFLFLLLPGALSAQQNAAPRVQPRPKIGVALEGGGAMGLAHIGVFWATALPMKTLRSAEKRISERIQIRLFLVCAAD